MKSRYEMPTSALCAWENLFTWMHLREFGLINYLFEEGNLSFKDRMKVEARLKREIGELCSRNLVD